MKDMTLEQLEKRKLELAADIKHDIAAFEKDTGLVPGDVTVHILSTTSDGEHCYVVTGVNILVGI